MTNYEFAHILAEVNGGSMSGTRMHEILPETWDNGYLPIESWTLPSGNVPILTLARASVFMERLAAYRSVGVMVDKLTAGVRNSVATEGDRFHNDLTCALAYVLVNNAERAQDWWLSVGIVSQGILVTSAAEPQHQSIHSLVHPSWNFGPAECIYPTGRAVEQAGEAERGAG